jgi:hypothetical protein
LRLHFRFDHRIENDGVRLVVSFDPARAIFYFASPNSMRLLLQQPQIAALRPGAAAANKPKN